MRALLSVAMLAAGLICATGCLPDKYEEPKWRKPPKSFDPQGGDLTFNKQGLDAFNTMDLSQREGFLGQLKSQPGTFKGQAVFKRSSEMGELVSDAELGKYEVFAVVPDPVLFEITLEYSLYTAEDQASALPPGAYIEFVGTLAELRFQDEAKPRKMELKVKADTITVLAD